MHYYKIQFAQRRPEGLRGGLLFLSVTVNPTIYRGGHFLFSAAGIFARHGKMIYRGGHIKMPTTENTLLTVAAVLSARHGKSIFRGGHIIRPATEKAPAQ